MPAGPAGRRESSVRRNEIRLTAGTRARRARDTQDDLSTGSALGERLGLADLCKRHPPHDRNRQLACRDGLCERSEALRIRVRQVSAHCEATLPGARGLTEHTADGAARFDLTGQLLKRLPSDRIGDRIEPREAVERRR